MGAVLMSLETGGSGTAGESAVRHYTQHPPPPASGPVPYHIWTQAQEGGPTDLHRSSLKTAFWD